MVIALGMHLGVAIDELQGEETECIRQSTPSLSPILSPCSLTLILIGISYRATVSQAKPPEDIVCAAIDEELWGDRASHVIVDGDPGETCFDEVYFGRTELTAFRKYEDDEYVFLMNFDEIDISALRTRGAEWYFSEMY